MYRSPPEGVRRVGPLLAGSARARRGSPPSDEVAVWLSFLVPGTGHWRHGRRASALLFGFPVVGVGVMLLAGWLGGLDRFVLGLITPSSALTASVLILLLGVWRIAAMVDVLGARGERRSRRARPVLLVAALAAVTIAAHGYLGYVTWTLYEAGTRIFVAEGGADLPTADPVRAIGELADPPTDGRRVTILLTSIDSSVPAVAEVTDTLIVLSVDPRSGESVLISIPGELTQFELPDGSRSSEPISSLYARAAMTPGLTPDAPMSTLAAAVSHLVGSPIHYHATVDLTGFRTLVDTMGGVRIEVERAIDDPDYEWLDGSRGFRIEAGEQVLDGATALAYVRSHAHDAGDVANRSRRQLAVLAAIRSQLVSPDRLPALPGIIAVAGSTVRTNMPSETAADLIELALETNTSPRQVVIGPPYADLVAGADSARPLLRLNGERWAERSIELFGPTSRYAAD